MNIDPPPIPLALFKKMASSLSADDLGKIPAEKLPDSIPIDLLESISPANAAKIDELILDRQAMVLKRRRALSKALGTEAAAACHLAERGQEESPATPLRESMLQLRGKRQLVNGCNTVTDAINLLGEFDNLRILATRVREDQNHLIHYRKVLRPMLFNHCKHQEILRRADQKLAEFATENCSLLGRFFAERAAVCLLIMEGYSTMRQKHSGIRQELAQRLASLNHRLHSASSESSMTSESRKRTPYVTRLSEEIKALFSKLRMHDVALSESDLIQWMDVVLDISLYRRTKDVYETLASRAEDALAELTHAYFEGIKLDESESRSLAGNSIAKMQQRDFDRRTELFLQRYLQTKQQELATHQCITASDRLYAFKRVERKLAAALRNT